MSGRVLEEKRVGVHKETASDGTPCVGCEWRPCAHGSKSHTHTSPTGPNQVTAVWSTSCRTICGSPGGRGRQGRPTHVGEKAVSCTRLRQSQKASSSNAHHRLKNVRARIGAGTLMVPIERAGWGFRRRDRGEGNGLADGVLSRRWTVFPCGTENMRALTWRLLLAASNGLPVGSSFNMRAAPWAIK